MAKRHPRYAPVGEYTPLHITALGAALPVGHAVGTTASVALSAGAQATVSPASMNGIVPGMLLSISGAGTPEDVRVISTVPGTSFTAFFNNAHSGTIQITSHRGTFLDKLIINQPGSGITITLYNGNPNATQYTGVAIAVITGLVAGQSFLFGITCDAGLYYTLAGTTAGDYTLTYVDQDD